MKTNGQRSEVTRSTHNISSFILVFGHLSLLAVRPRLNNINMNAELRNFFVDHDFRMNQTPPGVLMSCLGLHPGKGPYLLSLSG